MNKPFAIAVWCCYAGLALAESVDMFTCIVQSLWYNVALDFLLLFICVLIMFSVEREYKRKRRDAEEEANA